MRILNSARRFRWATLIVVALFASACAAGDGGTQVVQSPEPSEDSPRAAGQSDDPSQAESGGGETIIVGSANFPEQLILANLYADVVEATGATVERRLNLGSREIILPALESGDINLLPEYNGALLAFLDAEATEKSPEGVTAALRDALPDGLVALDPAQAQDRDGVAVLRETADRLSLTSIADLAPVAGDLVFGGPPETETRDAGLPGLRDVYGVEFKEFRALDAGGPLTTEALESGDIDVARVFTTQGVIAENDWVLLDDPENLSPAQNIIPVIRKDVLTDAIQSALDDLSALLTTEDLTAMNRRVEIDKDDPEEAARDYLEDKGLL